MVDSLPPTPSRSASPPADVGGEAAAAPPTPSPRASEPMDDAAADDALADDEAEGAATSAPSTSPPVLARADSETLAPDSVTV
jgi:hypothetical protein